MFYTERHPARVWRGLRGQRETVGQNGSCVKRTGVEAMEGLAEAQQSHGNKMEGRR